MISKAEYNLEKNYIVAVLEKKTEECVEMIEQTNCQEILKEDWVIDIRSQHILEKNLVYSALEKKKGAVPDLVLKRR